MGTWAVTAGLLASLLSVAPSPAAQACGAATNGSVSGHAFLYCGYHWASWPIPFGVDPVPALANIKVTTAQFTTITRNAATEWNDWWIRVRPPGNAKVPFSYVASSTNRVRFGSLPVGIPGRTVTGPPSSKVITSGTITLNSNVKWEEADLIEYLKGQPGSLQGQGCPNIPDACDWFDVQNVVTHELGHLLGLEHPGDEATCWPGNRIEEYPSVVAMDVYQTMYACTLHGDTSKRSLEWGDLAGLRRVAEDSS